MADPLDLLDPLLSGICNHRPVDERLATSGQPTEPQLHAIAQAGYRTVINLALHDDPRYSLPDEAGVVQGLGLAYVHIPVQFAAPLQGDLLRFFAAMDAHRQHKVWVHCAANIRASVFVGLYCIIRQGWAPEQAFALMHGLWQPNEVWSAFITAALAQPVHPTSGVPV